MLTDLENPSEEWTLPIKAPSLEVARSRCEVIANHATLTEVISVTQSSKKQNKQGEYSFVCWFKSEVSFNDSSNS